VATRSATSVARMGSATHTSASASANAVRAVPVLHIAADASAAGEACTWCDKCDVYKAPNEAELVRVAAAQGTSHRSWRNGDDDGEQPVPIGWPHTTGNPPPAVPMVLHVAVRAHQFCHRRCVDESMQSLTGREAGWTWRRWRRYVAVGSRWKAVRTDVTG
jgi:hypothetical protein